ncbi:MAG: Na/Pi cotransporter family protein [Deltaproteobacteria bacterium]|nr:Na/Pi cotransporter family protein [Deltaproteobacteria bacterium]
MQNYQMIIKILGGLSFFLLGMTTLSDSLQRVAGDKMRSLLAAMTRKTWMGVFTGFFVTAIIQSSSATTVMLVSFVNAGLMNLEQSIGVILGANVGTTVTGWLVSILGFKIKMKLLALPAITLGFTARFMERESIKNWGELLLGFGLLFFGLEMMNEALKTPENMEMVKGWMSYIHARGVISRLAVVVIGASATMLIQSSSAAMAITLILVYQGVIDYPTACALILGQNIGTTITANLAAIGANVTARQTARAHMLFNILGVLVVLVSWPLWMKITPIFAGTIPEKGASATIHLSLFHTAFNVINTLLFFPFTRQLASLSKYLVKEKDVNAKSMYYLKYIDFNLIPTPQLAVMAARKDIELLGSEVISTIQNVRKLQKKIDQPSGELVSSIFRQEEKIDKMAQGIVEYLVHLSQASLSYELSAEIAALMHTVSDYEKMGDHCEQLTKLLRRKHDKKYKFSTEAHDELRMLSKKVLHFVHFTHNHILEHQDILKKAYKLENEINILVKKLRKANIHRISENSCMLEGGLIYINMLQSYEKIGDHNVNISEEISGAR